MGSFWGGVAVRAGELAHERNMLDIQQKVEKHKAFMEHLNKIAEDPAYLPEAQMAARRKWMEASQAGPMKFKNYDISDILTVKSPAVTSGPGAPEEEGGPADALHPQFYRPTRQAGEPEITRSGKWSPFEQAAMESEANALKQRRMYEETLKYRKELVKPGADPVDSRVEMTGSALSNAGIKTTSDGQSILADDTNRYQHVTHRSGRTEIYGPIPPQYRPGDVEFDPASNQWVRSRFNTQTGGTSASPGGRLQPAVPGGLKQEWGMDPATKQWAQYNYDPYTGRVYSMMPGTPPTGIAGSTLAHEVIVDLGDRKEPRLMYSTRTPGATPAMLPQGAPAVTPPPTPGAIPTLQPMSTSQGAAPAPATSGAAAPVIPPPPVVQHRTVAAAKTGATQDQVKQSMSPDFKPNHLNSMLSTGTGTVYMGVSTKSDTGPRFTLYKGTRPMTPKEIIQNKNDAKLYNATIKLVNDVLDNSKILDSLWTAGKLRLMTDPNDPQQFISRVLGGQLSPEEAKVATAFISLTEHINRLRTPLGAAGFRSLEAFMTLQQQRGSLLMNPQLTRGVLQNSLKSLLTLRSTHHWMQAKNDRVENKANLQIIQDYVRAYGKDEAPAMLREDEYSEPD